MNIACPTPCLLFESSGTQAQNVVIVVRAPILRKPDTPFESCCLGIEEPPRFLTSIPPLVVAPTTHWPIHKSHVRKRTRRDPWRVED